MDNMAAADALSMLVKQRQILNGGGGM